MSRIIKGLLGLHDCSSNLPFRSYCYIGHYCHEGLNLLNNTITENPPDVGVTSGQKPSTKIIYIVLQTSVVLF